MEENDQIVDDSKEDTPVEETTVSSEEENSDLSNEEINETPIEDSNEDIPTEETKDPTGIQSRNEHHHKFIDSNKLNQKIVLRVIILILCSFIYVGIHYINLGIGVHDIQTKFTNTFISVIMYVCFVLSFIGILFLLLISVSVTIKTFLATLKYKIRNIIFNILDWLIILPICTVIATFCFSFLFTLGTVDGSSMSPNFSSEDTVFINYLAKIDRGDVVVAYITIEDNTVESVPQYKTTYPEYYIKRVIGVGGDTVTWENGILSVNGEVVDESGYFSSSQIESYHKYCANPFTGTFVYKEDNTVKTSTVIPEGYYFVMGDNRNNSRDSRMIGLIPKKNLIGEVEFRFTNSRIEKV